MRTLKFLLHKEFTQIRRNRFMARAILMVPIVQMLILVPAVTFDIRNIKLSVVDLDLSSVSRGLEAKLEGSKFFKLAHGSFSVKKAENMMHKGKVDAILVVPPDFEKHLLNNGSAEIQLLLNGINSSLAQTALVYLTALIQNYNQNIIMDNIAVKPFKPPSRISVRNRFWFNEEMDYKIYMAPGILGVLVTAVGFLLSGLNLVREKEIGTSEQINVTPIKKHEFILGKMIPFMIIGIVELAFGLTLARFVYSMPFEGSFLLLALFTFVYLIAIMGLGLFLSTFAGTQQQYLFICFFFMMIFMLMSGIFTPADSMPVWAQQVNHLNPTAYLIRVIRSIILKGSGFGAISKDLALLSLIALLTTSLASLKYKKTI